MFVAVVAAVVVAVVVVAVVAIVVAVVVAVAAVVAIVAGKIVSDSSNKQQKHFCLLIIKIFVLIAVGDYVLALPVFANKNASLFVCHCQ